jgi:hypothetical protein
VSVAPYYVDPSSADWVAPNLIAGLMKSPATDKQHPLERQATIVLAWLLDRSDAFTRAFLTLCLADDESAQAAVHSASTIGARAWGTLQPIDGLTGYLYPDITITGSDRAFELLLEIKVDASVHGWPVVEGTVLQPDAYLRSWLDNYAPETEALVRRIGTLTKAGPGVAFDDLLAAYRARDVTWREVRMLLSSMLTDGKLDPDVSRIAEDTIDAIDSVVLATAAGCPPELVPELAWACEHIPAMLARLCELVPGGTLKQQPRYVASSNYVGGNLFFGTPDGERCLWVYVTPPDWPYHAGDGEISLWAAEQTDHGRWPPALADRAIASGFAMLHPKTQGIGLRRAWPLADLMLAGDADAVGAVTNDLMRLLVSSADD